VSRNIKKEYPEIFVEWHPSLNGNVNPNKVRKRSRKKYYWKCCNKKCGYTWKATIYSRTILGNQCPKCQQRKAGVFSRYSREIKSIFKKIKKLQQDIYFSVDIFVDDVSSFTKKRKNSAISRKKIEEINRLGTKIRNFLLLHKKNAIEIKRKKQNKLINLNKNDRKENKSNT